MVDPNNPQLNLVKLIIVPWRQNTVPLLVTIEVGPTRQSLCPPSSPRSGPYSPHTRPALGPRAIVLTPASPHSALAPPSLGPCVATLGPCAVALAPRATSLCPRAHVLGPRATALRPARLSSVPTLPLGPCIPTLVLGSLALDHVKWVDPHQTRIFQPNPPVPEQTLSELCSTHHKPTSTTQPNTCL